MPNPTIEQKSGKLWDLCDQRHSTEVKRWAGQGVRRWWSRSDWGLLLLLCIGGGSALGVEHSTNSDRRVSLDFWGCYWVPFSVFFLWAALSARPFGPSFSSLLFVFHSFAHWPPRIHSEARAHPTRIYFLLFLPFFGADSSSGKIILLMPTTSRTLTETNPTDLATVSVVCSAPFSSLMG